MYLKQLKTLSNLVDSNKFPENDWHFRQTSCSNKCLSSFHQYTNWFVFFSMYFFWLHRWYCLINIQSNTNYFRIKPINLIELSTICEFGNKMLLKVKMQALKILYLSNSSWKILNILNYDWFNTLHVALLLRADIVKGGWVVINVNSF